MFAGYILENHYTFKPTNFSSTNNYRQLAGMTARRVSRFS